MPWVNLWMVFQSHADLFGMEIGMNLCTMYHVHRDKQACISVPCTGMSLIQHSVKTDSLKRLSDFYHLSMKIYLFSIFSQNILYFQCAFLIPSIYFTKFIISTTAIISTPILLISVPRA